MNTLKDFVNFKLTHADKTAEAEGYPLTLQNCKKHKKMKQLEIYGNSKQDGAPSPENSIEVQSIGELVSDESDINHGKYKIPVITHGKNLYSPYDIWSKNEHVKLTEDGRECIRFTSSVNTLFYGRFKENTQYTVSFCCKCTFANQHTSTSTTYDVPFCFVYTDGSKSSLSVTRNGEWTNKRLTSAEGKTVAWIGTNSFDYKQWNYVDVNTFQIEEGAYVTEREPYVEPNTTNIFLDKPLGSGEYIDFKNKKVVRGMSNGVIECQLPTLISKTTIIEVDTSLEPSSAYGKYIKR